MFMEEQVNYQHQQAPESSAEDPERPANSPMREFRDWKPANTPEKPGKQIRKSLRRKFHPVGWGLAVTLGIMFASTFVFIFVVGCIAVAGLELPYLPHELQAQIDIVMERMDIGWSLVLYMAISMLAMLLWKKPAYFRSTLLQRGKPMTAGTFALMVAMVLGVQFANYVVNILQELLLNGVGLSMIQGLESATNLDLGLGMFLAGTILAPIVEEIIFRGVVLRTLQPFGRRFAVIASALLFGIFHANPAQNGFAFLVGLVLAYVTVEHNLLWAMVLHMVNNLGLAYLYSAFTADWNEVTSTVLLLGMMLAGFVVSLVVLIQNRSRVKVWMAGNSQEKYCWQALLSHPGVIIVMAYCLLNMVLTFTTI